MSKPSPNYFCQHLGFYRNARTISAKRELKGSWINLNSEWVACLAIPMLWTYSGENQTDGDLSRLSTADFREIFASNHLLLTQAQTERIIRALKASGFIGENGLLHSWDKFNRHFVEYDSRREIKRRAANERWRKFMEAKGGGGLKTPELNGSPSKDLWTAKTNLTMIDEALKTAKGPAKKKLLRQRQELLSQSTGVDLSEPLHQKTALAKPVHKPAPGEFERTNLKNALQFIADGQPELLTERMARALIESRQEVPQEVRQKFPRLFEKQHEKEKPEHNPVPG